MFIGRNKLSRLYTGALALLMIAACGGDSTVDRDSELENARAAVASGNIAEATEICNGIIGDSASLSPESMVNLAVIYMEIADNSDHPDMTDMVGSAIDCYRNAALRDSVATARCVTSLPSAEYVYALILNSLIHALDANDTIIPYDFEFASLDSIL